MTSDTHVYKLLNAADWQAAQAAGETATALDLGDGYVHLSSGAQVAETARLHYAGKAQTRLLRFRVADLPPLKWEPSRGGQLFPHLYGALKMSKAEAVWMLMLDEDGAPRMPEDL